MKAKSCVSTGHAFASEENLEKGGSARRPGGCLTPEVHDT